MQRINDFWARDLDALHEVAGEHDGPLRITSAGPWTLAAHIWQRTGGAMLADEGAVRDLTQSLTEGLRQLMAEVTVRLPRSTVSLQLDEPSLPAVLAGEVATESGFGFYRPVEADIVRERLRSLIAALPVPVVVHSCASGVPLTLLREAGAAAASIDLTTINVDDAPAMDALGENLDAGLRLIAGVVSTEASVAVDGKKAASVVSDLWNRLGFSAAQLPQRVSVSPRCGLASMDPDSARSALYYSREVAKYLHD